MKKLYICAGCGKPIREPSCRVHTHNGKNIRYFHSDGNCYNDWLNILVEKDCEKDCEHCACKGVD